MPPKPPIDNPPPPDRQQILDLLWDCNLPTDVASITAAQHALSALTEALAAERRHTEPVRSTQRRQRLATQKAIVVALRDLPDALKLRRPRAVRLNPVLERELAHHLNAGEFEKLIGALKGNVPTTFDQNVASATITAELDQPNPTPAATGKRRRITPSQASKMVPAMAQMVLPLMKEILRREQLHPGGRPLNRPRRVAFRRLLELHEVLTGRPARAQPSAEYLGFCNLAFPLLGLDEDGLEEAAERFFQHRRQRKNAILKPCVE